MFHRIPRLVRLVLVPVAVLAVGAGAYAGSTGFNPIEHHQMMHDRLFSELALTDSQQTEIDALLEETRAQGEALHAEHEALLAQGLALFSAPELDPEAVEAQRQELLELADQGTALMADTVLDVGRILTPAQRVTLANRVRSFHDEGGPFAPPRHPWHR